MEWLQQLLDIFFNLDTYLSSWVAMLGPWFYLVLFLIIFCETGLVVTPFLPGDSLLFSMGAVASLEASNLSMPLLTVVLCAAAILGDFVNYSIGRHLGMALFSGKHNRLFNRNHLMRAQQFYERHGGKTIFLARFIPIVRTFAPFVAGMGEMNYRRFVVFNWIGGIVWVGSFLFAGYFFGNLPAVQRDFHYVIVAIIILSILPALVEYWRAERRARQY